MMTTQGISFIFLNMVGIIALTTIVVYFDVRVVYAVPICILPLILKTFFDPRLGLFTHVITVLNLGFVVPNSFEFVFLQMMAGMLRFYLQHNYKIELIFSSPLVGSFWFIWWVTLLSRLPVKGELKSI